MATVKTFTDGRSPQCQIGDHNLCKVVSKSGIRCACRCHLTAEEREAKREQERAADAAFRASHPDYIPTYGPSNADMERQLGAKKARDDGGRELEYYDIEPGDTHISGACGEHQHRQPCYDSRCQCACHQPVPTGADFYNQRLQEYRQMRSQSSGSARIAPEPEKHEETTEQPIVTGEPRIAEGRLARVEVRLTQTQKDMLTVFCQKTGNHLSTFMLTAALAAMRDEMMKHPSLFM